MMNLEEYNLVLMVSFFFACVSSFTDLDSCSCRVLSCRKLDSISATSMIRQFDHMTPIISTTSNSKPNKILTYNLSGEYQLVALASGVADNSHRCEQHITKTPSHFILHSARSLADS